MSTEENKVSQEPKETQKPNENSGVYMEGHIKIFDPKTNEILVNKRNAIHYENMSISLAESLGNEGKGNIVEMSFGNGGTTVDPTGIITYLTPNNTGVNASLYNQTYYKTVDDNNVNNIDPARNFIETRHTLGTNYTDILVSCLLDYGEPTGQQAFDNSTNLDGQFVFDELGLRAFSTEGANKGRLLTHVIFHPVQKSLNRLIQIDYTVRIQSLTNLSGE
tara:strand:- start:7105 stop:7764 length:660 start_codon:yes stop_codon:yes gene_type:complete